ncbi:hypothetical protein G3580_18925 [Nitrogeniibacter mangrovi]|uniref:Lipoprotein n=1 Tax=Nitrogeniibacter mangrovi TaxID=2016596 RepID=A0A6C1B967_9RHOO|nr:hypothetical protein [Nitrogeniibacter mangrovi]QID19509.1 hypothetical protein G3580_18925 [Nitrogeniibacter mangrovi]
MRTKFILLTLLAVPLISACDKPQTTSTSSASADTPSAAAPSPGNPSDKASGMGGPEYPPLPESDTQKADQPASDMPNSGDGTSSMDTPASGDNTRQ